jgi:hypothetical protein
MRSEQDREQIIKVIRARQLPTTVELTKGAPRSIEQNRLQRLWMNEAAEQGDQTAEEYRAFCKLNFGIPIMCEQSPLFAEQWKRLFSHLSYEDKLALMAEPIDYPVTRLMVSRMKKVYLDRVYTHFTGMGFRMTDPKRFEDEQAAQTLNIKRR